jgi:hypothetical protein
MAIILQEKYDVDNYINGVIDPVLYVDSINEESFIVEMNAIILRYISNNPLLSRGQHQGIGATIKSPQSFDNLIANDEDDIYKNKLNGYWIVYNKSKQSLSLYIKHTEIGYLYNGINVNKIFTLTYKKCVRVVPQIFKKTTKFENFSRELADRVGKYKERASNFSQD